MSRIILVSLAAPALFLAGCMSLNSALNETTQVVEYYRIFDVHSTQPRAPVIAAARKGLTLNASNIQDQRPIPPATRPAEPGRFSATDPFKGTPVGSMGMMMGARGALMKVASCDGAVWIANATRTIGDAGANITLCLWEYTAGYHLDVYATYLKQEGGIGVKQLAKSVATSMVGTFEEALEKTVNDVAREIQTVGATVSYVEGYPDPIGEPWWSKSTPVAIQAVEPQIVAQTPAPLAPVAPVAPPAPVMLQAGQSIVLQTTTAKIYVGGSSTAEALTQGSTAQLLSKNENASGTWWYVDVAGKRGYVMEKDLLAR